MTHAWETWGTSRIFPREVPTSSLEGLDWTMRKRRLFIYSLLSQMHSLSTPYWVQMTHAELYTYTTMTIGNSCSDFQKSPPSDEFHLFTSDAKLTPLSISDLLLRIKQDSILLRLFWKKKLKWITVSKETLKRKKRERKNTMGIRHLHFLIEDAYGNNNKNFVR